MPIADNEPERLLIGETNVEQLPTLMGFDGDGRDELHGGFNFVFIMRPFYTRSRAVVTASRGDFGRELWPGWSWPTSH